MIENAEERCWKVQGWVALEKNQTEALESVVTTLCSLPKKASVKFVAKVRNSNFLGNSRTPYLSCSTFTGPYETVIGRCLMKAGQVVAKPGLAV